MIFYKKKCPFLPIKTPQYGYKDKLVEKGPHWAPFEKMYDIINHKTKI